MTTLGIRVKTGWAAVVLLGGTAKTPRLLDSREVRLSDWDLPHGRQPFHASFGTEQKDRALIARLVKGVERYARGALAALLREYAQAGHGVRRVAIVVSSLTDPASIANQHMRAHASEGQLYRRVVVEGLERSGLKTSVILDREVYAQLATTVRRSPAATKVAVAHLGVDASQWRSEEKVAAAGAWLLLSSQGTSLIREKRRA